MTTATKRCAGRCGRVLPLDAFHKCAANVDGRKGACKDCRKDRLPEDVRAQQGLSPAQRAALDKEAKVAAIPFRRAVVARSAAEVQRITGPMSKEGVVALLLVMTEAVTDGWRLLAVTEALDDGLPEVRLAAVSAAAVVAEDASASGAEALSVDLRAVQENDAA